MNPSAGPPPDSPRAIITALGSRGDVNPMLAIAIALRCDGIRPLVIVAEPYVDVVRSLGLEAEVGISSELFHATINHPDLWRPVQGARLLLGDLVAPTLPDLYALIQRHHQPGRTILIAHPLDLASRIFRDAHPETPLASVHLAPATIRCYHDPPQMTVGLSNFRRPAWAVRLGYRLADRVLLRKWLEVPLNRFRSSLGLPPVRNPMEHWWYSPDRVLCLFPKTFGPKGLPDKFVYCGFPHYDGPETSNTNQLDLLKRFSGPPIVFTPGSAHVSARKFFETAVRYCESENAEGLLLTANPAQVPSKLPENVAIAGYIPLGKLLPHCRAIVHHGGVGTTSQSLAAGIPQIVCPMAFDQFDNGRRITNMGFGKMLPMNRLSVNRLRIAMGGLSSANHSPHAIDAETMQLNAGDFQARVVAEIRRLLVMRA